MYPLDYICKHWEVTHKINVQHLEDRSSFLGLVHKFEYSSVDEGGWTTNILGLDRRRLSMHCTLNQEASVFIFWMTTNYMLDKADGLKYKAQISSVSGPHGESKHLVSYDII